MIKYFILLSSMGSKKICLETTRAKCSVEAVEAVMRTEAAVGGCASRWTDGRLPTNGRRAKKPNTARRGAMAAANLCHCHAGSSTNMCLFS